MDLRKVIANRNHKLEKEMAPTLAWALQQEHLEVVKLLLEKGADPNHVDEDGWTPLLQATKKEHQEIVKLLLEKGADPNHADEDGWTPLMSASQNFVEEEIIKLLLENGANPLQVSNKGHTPLSLAVDLDLYNYCKLLLEYGANPHQLNKGFQTKLFAMAAVNDQLDIFKLLLEKEINLNQEDEGGCTPIFYSENTEILNFLLTNGADLKHEDKRGRNAIIEAERLDKVKLLLENGVDPNHTDNDGGTPLMQATDKKHLEIVKLLLEKGADPNHADENGWTPLMQATEKEHLEIVKLLLEKRADPNHANKINGWTPLMHASIKGHLNIVRFLLANGGDPNYADPEGWTAFDHAISAGHIDVVKLLLNNGAEPNHADPEGWTPLVYAAENENLEIVKLLLANGADPKLLLKENRLDPNQIDESTVHRLLGQLRAGNKEILSILAIAEILHPSLKLENFKDAETLIDDQNHTEIMGDKKLAKWYLDIFKLNHEINVGISKELETFKKRFCVDSNPRDSNPRITLLKDFPLNNLLNGNMVVKPNTFLNLFVLKRDNSLRLDFFTHAIESAFTVIRVAEILERLNTLPLEPSTESKTTPESGINVHRTEILPPLPPEIWLYILGMMHMSDLVPDTP